MPIYLDGQSLVLLKPSLQYIWAVRKVVDKGIHLSNEKNPGCLGYIRDYTTQVYRDYDKPL